MCFTCIPIKYVYNISIPEIEILLLCLILKKLVCHCISPNIPYLPDPAAGRKVVKGKSEKGRVNSR